MFDSIFALGPCWKPLAPAGGKLGRSSSANIDPRSDAHSSPLRRVEGKLLLLVLQRNSVGGHGRRQQGGGSL